jgi:hypothetical protein
LQIESSGAGLQRNIGAQASRARLRILARTRKVNKTKTLILMVAVILAGFGTASLGAAVLMLVV